jgi:glucose-6-phosphate isomerase
VLLVIGIGGSYLGARAAIEFLKSPYYNSMKKDTPDIYFIGNSFSTDDLEDVISLCEGREVAVNVISKSGTTTESSVAFRFIRKMMEEKYTNHQLKDRIFVTTDRQRGALKAFADREGYETFVIPDDIGGRFSVLTAVGLLPIAVSGADIDALLAGAAKAKKAFAADINNDAYNYAVLRNIFYSKGKYNEILCSYEPALRYITEWWKQLFGESEGKDGKGIFPVSMIFSTDLHSLGQYIQDGRRNMFETVLRQKNSNNHMYIPRNAVDIDGLNFFSGQTLESINEKAFLGTMLAHVDGGVPNVVIEYERRDEENLGELIYFFSLACAASGYMLGVNPFNQPGVEDYKRNMFALLGKPGFEELNKTLNEKLNEVKF